jgi:hypothetical protein
MFGARYCVYSLLLGRVQGSMVQIQGLQVTGLETGTIQERIFRAKDSHSDSDSRTLLNTPLASAAHGPGCNANVYNLNRFARDKVQNDH